MNDVKSYLDPAEEKMELAVAYLEETLARIRAGIRKFWTVYVWTITAARHPSAMLPM